MKRGLRFWLVYGVAWLPYAVSYVAIFIQQGSSLQAAIVDALVNVITAAVLGIAVLWVCQRLPWLLYKRPWFVPLHVLLAITYAALWVTAVSLVFTVLTSIERSKVTVVYLRSYALQWEFFSGLMIYAMLASLAYVFQISVNLREEERRARETELRAARAEALHTRAELTALRGKLNPHFLFNTLHSLMALMRNDRAEAETAIDRFSSMLRYVLRGSEEFGTHERIATQTTFADEWEFVENYLALEQLRLGDRLKVETQIQSEAFDALVPPLSVQPLVENAIKHAVAPRALGGTIRVVASMNGDYLIVTVSDDGCGANQNEVADSSGLGLKLIGKTLSTQYEGRAQFEIETAPQKGFTVRLTIPQDSGDRVLVREAYAR